MSRRDQIRLSDEEVRRFLAASKTIILTSNGPGGYPHPMPMWFVLGDDGTLSITTYKVSQKVKNIQRDPRVSVLAESGTEYSELKGVVLYGHAEIIDDLDTVIDTLIAALVNQAGNEHGCSGTRLAQVFFKNRPAGFEIQPVGQNIVYAHNIVEAAAGLK